MTKVNFETARLLKEKRFGLPCSDYYTPEGGGLMSNGWGEIIYEQGFGSGVPDRLLKFDYSDFSKVQKETCFLCPTIAEVVMWLYEKHDIWITVERHEPKALFNYVIVYQDEFTNKESRGKGYSSPTESYSEAINYSLKNLIK